VTRRDSRAGARSPGWVTYVTAFVLLVGIAMLTIATARGGAQTAIPSPGWSVTATSSTTGLADGQRVSVNVRSNQDVSIFRVEVRQCRLDAAYSDVGAMLTSAGNCPGTPLSSSSDQVVLRSISNRITEAAQSTSGATLTLKVGIGIATWKPGPDVPETSLTCDPTHDCALVTEVRLASGTFYSVTPLSFADADPVAACGGPAAGILSTAGSDRVSDLWSGWTREFCERGLATGAPTRASFGAEGTAIQLFADGSIDLAYTGLGYDAAAGLGPPDPTDQRGAVATPVALNAAVIAVGGGFIQTTGDKAAYPEIKMTAAEVSAFFAGGAGYIIRQDLPFESAILARNPVLGGHLFSIIPTVRPLAHSDSQASSWLLGRFLAAHSPDQWIVVGSDPVVHRGASVAMALADPPFGDLETFTGRPVLQKFTEQATASLSTDGGIWAMTDLATARALGMTPVSIETAPGSGVFVAPTAESMAAAVPSMQADAHGILLPDPSPPSAAIAAAAVPAYPLTYVEYALAPAQPLVDPTTCALKVDAQNLLAKWLAFATGDGQASLAPGLSPLPASLQASAAAAVQQVGASPITGACAPGGSGVAPGGGAAAPASAVAPGGSTGAPTAGRGPAVGAPGSAASGSTPLSAEDAAAKQDRVLVPAFAGHQLASTSDGMLALLGIVVITSLAAWLTAGRTVGSITGGDTAAAAVRRPPAAIALLWVGVALAGMGLVVYQLGPIVTQRDQRELLASYRRDVRQAANQTSGLQGVETPKVAPESGDAVGVLEIGAIRIQGVVVEGASATQTQEAPGHVPGTAGLGQPGNSVVVGRRNGFGAQFANLESVRKGDRVLVTSTQGQSVYVVTSNRTHTIVAEDDDSTSSSSTGSASSSTATGEAKDPAAASTSTSTTSPGATGGSSGTRAAATTPHRDAANRAATPVTLDTLYGETPDDRLTLVTSASRQPWNSSDATVVVAKMKGVPFERTPQGGRSDGSSGRTGDPGVWPAIALVLLLYAGVIAASVALYRRLQFRVAYVLTIAPLVALTVLAGDTLSRLLPAWT